MTKFVPGIADVLEDLSENFLERKVLKRGHVLQRPKRDYGVDVTMFHYADNGEIENGEIRFQLKAYALIKMFHRKKLKEEIESIHDQLFNDPNKRVFQQNIYQLFK